MRCIFLLIAERLESRSCGGAIDRPSKMSRNVGYVTCSKILVDLKTSLLLPLPTSAHKLSGFGVYQTVPFEAHHPDYCLQDLLTQQTCRALYNLARPEPENRVPRADMPINEVHVLGKVHVVDLMC